MILLEVPKLFPALNPLLTENDNALACSSITQDLGSNLMFIQLMLGNWNGTAFTPSQWYPSITVELNVATLQMSVNNVVIALVPQGQVSQIQSMFKAIEHAFETWFTQHYSPNFSGSVV